jgi:hypothetical protein
MNDLQNHWAFFDDLTFLSARAETDIETEKFSFFYLQTCMCDLRQTCQTSHAPNAEGNSISLLIFPDTETGEGALDA